MTTMPRRGFTLLEVVVVLLIVGMVAALAAPSISRLLPERGAETELRSLVSFLRAERVAAIETQSARTVRVFVEEPRAPIDADADPAWLSGAVRPIRPGSVRTSSDPDAPIRVAFDAEGRASLAELRFAERATGETPGADASATWHIAFDPIDGRPTLHRGGS